MNKYKLLHIKKRLLALGLSSTMIAISGCTINENEDAIPERVSISSEHSRVDNYYKYVIQNGEVVKLYNSQKVYLLFNKETYEVDEYIYQYPTNWLNGVELYDLESEEMITYSDGFLTKYNKEYYNYIFENSYQVCLKDASNYIEGHVDKEYYSLKEIKELESQIMEGLKIINSVKEKIKQ